MGISFYFLLRSQRSWLFQGNPWNKLRRIIELSFSKIRCTQIKFNFLNSIAEDVIQGEFVRPRLSAPIKINPPIFLQRLKCNFPSPSCDKPQFWEQVLSASSRPNFVEKARFTQSKPNHRHHIRLWPRLMHIPWGRKYSNTPAFNSLCYSGIIPSNGCQIRPRRESLKRKKSHFPPCVLAE